MRIKNGFVLREVAGQIMVIATGEASKDFHGMQGLWKKRAFQLTAKRKQGGIFMPISVIEEVKTEFETKLANLKITLLEKISEFKQDFTCENADKVSELKFSVENLNNKNLEVVTNLVEEIRNKIK